MGCKKAGKGVREQIKETNQIYYLNLRSVDMLSYFATHIGRIKNIFPKYVGLGDSYFDLDNNIIDSVEEFVNRLEK